MTREARAGNTDLDPTLVDAAASWFVRLSSGVVSAEERASFEHWRQANSEHARAWSRFEALQQTIQHGTVSVPASIATSTLRAARRRLTERRLLLKSLAAIGVAIPAAHLARQNSSLRHAFADLRTGVGERRRVTLDDGTQLWMNTATAADLHFDGRERRLLLRSGEIQIATAADPAGRPFIVTTVDGSLQPIGTRFGVRRFEDETTTRLYVTEGAVEVRPRDSAAARRVVAGESLQFDSSQTSALTLTGADAWVDGMLGAERTRLEDFLVELARYRRGLLRCDPAVADLRLTGTFPLADTDRVLAKLAETLPVSVHYRTRYWVTVTAR